MIGIIYTAAIHTAALKAGSTVPMVYQLYLLGM